MGLRGGVAWWYWTTLSVLRAKDRRLKLSLKMVTHLIHDPLTHFHLCTTLYAAISYNSSNDGEYTTAHTGPVDIN